MGNHGSRTIHIDNVQDHLNSCQEIQALNCPIYGNVHYVSYNGMQFFLGQSKTQSLPHPKALHYLVNSGLLVISQFQLLENINPQSIQEVLQIVLGIAEMGKEHDLGIGYGRIAYAGRWGIVGEKPCDWTYHQILEQGNSEGVYLSPKQMISLSQNRKTSQHSTEKSDVFALGIMLVEMIFADHELGQQIFDYENCELKLQFLLEKLIRIREEYQEYNDTIYDMFIGMLEIEEEDRFSFQQLFDYVNEVKKNWFRMNSSKLSSSSRKCLNKGSKIQPPKNGRDRVQSYRNDVSPLRNRFSGKTKTNENEDRINRSPLRKHHNKTQQERQPQCYEQIQPKRRVLSPISQRRRR